MREALAEAEQAPSTGDVPIGAVIVDDAGQILARGRNVREAHADPAGHAEIVALQGAARARGSWRLDGCTLVVTLEPCAMCAGAISHARIGRLVFGAEDGKGGGVMHGARVFDQSTCHWRPKVESGLLATDSAALLRSFFRERR